MPGLYDKRNRAPHPTQGRRAAPDSSQPDDADDAGAPVAPPAGDGDDGGGGSA